jgi:hypothetical protein
LFAVFLLHVSVISSSTSNNNNNNNNNSSSSRGNKKKNSNINNINTKCVMIGLDNHCQKLKDCQVVSFYETQTGRGVGAESYTRNKTGHSHRKLHKK